MKREMIENYLECPICGFPVHSSRIIIKCPFCGQQSKVSEVVMKSVAMRGKGTRVQGQIQGASFSFSSLLIGLGIGVLFGPVILASTREGARILGKMAEEKMKKI